jgi:phosphoglycerate dehydrogenase-like enzyme
MTAISMRGAGTIPPLERFRGPPVSRSASWDSAGSASVLPTSREISSGVSLEGLFEQADAISIHCLLNDETRGMVGDVLLGKMKPGSYLVNTARGAVIDVNALLRALEQNRLTAVGLDVLPVEPIEAGSPLLADPRVILSPHAAFYSVEAEIELRRKAAMNIVDWMKTGRPGYPVVQGTRKP